MADYSEQQLFGALRKADAAGDVAAAKAIARRIQTMRQAAPAAPQQPSTSTGLSDSQWQGERDKLAQEGTGQGFMGNAVAGYGRALPVMASGIKQAGMEAADRTVAAAYTALYRLGLGGAAESLGRNVGAPLQGAIQRQQGVIDQELQDSAKLRDTAGGMVGNVVGDLATMLPAGGPLMSLAKTGGSRLLANMAVGGGLGASQPVATGGPSRIQNTGVGVGAAALGVGAEKLLKASAGKAVAAVDPLRKQLVGVAERAGIPLHISQLSQSIPVKTMASAAKYLPFSGAGKAANNQQSAFNRAIAKTFGADAPQLTDDVMTAARQKLSAQFEDIYARNDVPITPEAMRKLVAVENNATDVLTKADGDVVRKQLDNILKEMQDGGLTGQKYQALRSKIMTGEGPDKLGGAIKAVRKALDDIAADAVGPEDAATLKQIRGQWANFRTTQDILKQMSGASGNVKPAAIWAAIRKGSTKEMRELGRLGQVLLKDPIPDSGTTGRNMAAVFMGGGGVAGGLAALPTLSGLLVGGATVGRALNSSALAKLMGKSNPGATRTALSKLAPASGVAAGPVVNEELDARRRKRLVGND